MDAEQLAEIRRILESEDFDPTEWPPVLTRELLDHIAEQESLIAAYRAVCNCHTCRTVRAALEQPHA